MPKQPSRDGVFQRTDAPGWHASYVDASGKRRKCRVQAYTRPQAVAALNGIKAKVQQEKILGVKHVSDISTEDLLARYKRHQRPRIAASTFARLNGLLGTLKAHLPAKLKDVTKAAIAEYIGERVKAVSAGTVAKEISTLKHALRLAVEWELIHVNPAARAKLPRLPEGRTRYLSPAELRTVLDTAPGVGARADCTRGFHWDAPRRTARASLARRRSSRKAALLA